MRWLAALVAVAACGGGGEDGPYGVYQVTQHTQNDAGCTGGTAAADPPYFSFDYFGMNVQGLILYAVRGCSSIDEATCMDVIGLVTEAPVGWFAFTADATWSGSTCTLDFTSYTASGDGETFQLGIARHEATTSSQSQCTSDEANRLRDMLPCVAAETIAGARVAP